MNRYNQSYVDQSCIYQSHITRTPISRFDGHSRRIEPSARG